MITLRGKNFSIMSFQFLLSTFSRITAFFSFSLTCLLPYFLPPPCLKWFPSLPPCFPCQTLFPGDLSAISVPLLLRAFLFVSLLPSCLTDIFPFLPHLTLFSSPSHRDNKFLSLPVYFSACLPSYLTNSYSQHAYIYRQETCTKCFPSGVNQRAHPHKEAGREAENIAHPTRSHFVFLDFVWP